ncbi:MAG: hypothetical protein ACAI44_29690 [Candidatus Sericytochromatia bacterium]
MSDSLETLKDSEVEALRSAGQEVADYKAVIRTKRAAKLVIPSLGTFYRDNPVHTNDEALIEAALGAGGLAVTIDPARYKTRAQRKAEEKAKADAKPKGDTDPKGDPGKPSAPKS